MVVREYYMPSLTEAATFWERVCLRTCTVYRYTRRSVRWCKGKTFILGYSWTRDCLYAADEHKGGWLVFALQ